MKRREFIGAALGAAAAGIISGGKARAAQGRRPNVLFILTDDQRRDTIHALGNSVIRTPTYDSLVEDGVTFKNAYCMGGNSAAVCAPSRQSLLRGVSWFSIDKVKRSDPCLPRTMNEAGYITYHLGKRFNNDSRSLSFFQYNHYLEPSEKEARAGGEPDRYLADHSIAFLRRWKKGALPEGRKPFFMYLAGASPHDPRIAPPEYLDLYPLDQIPLPPNLLPFHPFDNGELLVRDEFLAPWPRDEETIRAHLRDYYAVITYQDEQCARILNELRDLGEYDNTIIVFASDNGLALGSHGLMGKQNLYEHGMGVPLVISGPGIPKGKASNALSYLFDLYPTLCDFAGAPVPASLEGKSLAPVIRGEVDSVRDSILLGYKKYQRAVRQGDWKLIRYPEVEVTQLFNLSSDPHETRDLALDQKQGERIEELSNFMRQQQAHFGDRLSLNAPCPRKAEVGLDYFRSPKAKWHEMIWSAIE